MRCPKCHYISFDDSSRCRNCGYEFSLAVEVPKLDLPIQTGDEPVGPLSDLTLGEHGAAASAASPRQPAADVQARATAANEADLPLFNDRAGDDDAPLVTPPAVPRAPLAVRRSSPHVPRARRSEVEEPELDLDLPDFHSERDVVESRAPERDSHSSVVVQPVAGIGPRLLAGLVDLAILGGIDAAVLYFTLKICGFVPGELLLLPVVPLAAFLILLGGGYLVAFVAAGGQTIGKMAAGIRVVPAINGETAWTDRVPLGTAFVRAAATLISLAPAGAGLLPALLGADRRALHDRLAHTRVVKA